MVKVVGQDNNVSINGEQSKVLIDPTIILRGEKGEKGIDGLPGKDGLPGRDGVDGKDGRDGRDGRDGVDGKDGISYWIEYDKKTNTLVFNNDGGKKNPDPIKLPPTAKGWGYGAGRGGGQVQADWNQTDKTNPTYIKNKPTPCFAKSTTAAGTVEKVVSIPSIKKLEIGTTIIVQPTVTSTVANSKIKLNDFDSYLMRYNNANITTSTDSVVWNSTFVSIFTFDGTYWQFVAHGIDSNTTYSTMSVSEGTTGTATSQRVVRADYLKSIILGTKLTGLNTSTAGAVVATDTVLSAMGKIQATIGDVETLINAL